jgi:hypothetical protein
MSGPQPFEISKEMVWEAYRRVKANRGAAGIDGETIEEYGRNLKGNLHKLWNRMSSGSYFTPPVRIGRDTEARRRGRPRRGTSRDRPKGSRARRTGHPGDDQAWLGNTIPKAKPAATAGSATASAAK